MNVAFLVHSFKNGGAQNTLIKLANIFESKGHNVTVFVMSSSGPLRERICSRVKIIDLKTPRARSAIFPLLTALRKSNTEWVVTSLIAPSVIAIFAKLLCFGKVRVLIREASTPSLEKLDTAKKFILHYIVRLLFFVADRIVAVSNGVKLDFTAFYHINVGRVKVIYNPVIFDDVHTHRTKRIPFTGSLRLIFIGRVVRIKRLEVQVEALHLASKMISGLSLRICGDCPDPGYKVELNALSERLGVSKNLIWTDFQDDVYLQLAQADYLLLTSEVEGLPSVLIEALSVGVRVIAFDCPHGPREILDNGRIGRLIPPEGCTSATLASVIVEEALNPTPINIDDRHLQQFSSERVYQDYLNQMLS